MKIFEASLQDKNVATAVVHGLRAPDVSPAIAVAVNRSGSKSDAEFSSINSSLT